MSVTQTNPDARRLPNFVRRVAVPLTIFLVGILVYANTLDGEFLFSWDDNRYIAENDLIRDFSPDGIFSLFHGDDKFGLQFYFAGYIPITLLSYSIDYAIWGFEASGFHATSIVFSGIERRAGVFRGAALAGHARCRGDCGAVVPGASLAGRERSLDCPAQERGQYVFLFAGDAGSHAKQRR